MVVPSFLKKSSFWKTYLKGPHFSLDKISDLSGKGVVVTGANSGLGYTTMVTLAGHGAHVIAACRSEQRAKDAIEKAKQEIKTNSLGHEQHPQSGIDFEIINGETASDPAIRHGCSKLANILFCEARARRLKDGRFVATEVARSTEDGYGKYLTAVLDYLTMAVAMKPEVRALTQLYCATSPEIENLNVREKYLIPTANQVRAL
ncbi:hypothetical protein BG005_011706 [Podila minutissima]|nr:hypothetical protein BG005_011706 [Podila minutissima]